jgi:hypothetical protein
MRDQLSHSHKTTGKIVMQILIFKLSERRRKDKRLCTEWQQEFPEFNLVLHSSWTRFKFVTVLPKCSKILVFLCLMTFQLWLNICDYRIYHCQGNFAEIYCWMSRCAQVHREVLWWHEIGNSQWCGHSLFFNYYLLYHVKRLPVHKSKRDYINSMHQNLSEKLTVVMLLNKSPVFYRTRRFITVFTKPLKMECILSQLNPFHTLTPYSLNINFVTLPIRLHPPRGNFHSGFQTKIL